MNQYARSLTTRCSPYTGATNESDCRLPQKSEFLPRCDQDDGTTSLPRASDHSKVPSSIDLAF